MAPPRYGQQAMNGPYSQFQQSQLQSHSTSQHHGILPPPHLAAPAFGQGHSSNTSPFAMTGAMSNGFDRGMLDGGIQPGGGGQMGFPRGAAVSAHQSYDTIQQLRESKDESRIRNVWKHNLGQELANLRQLVETYPYIAMDTEFPGIVARPIGSFTTKADYHYQTLRCNVDLLKMIQLGISLFKPDGSLPPPDSTSSTKSSQAYLASMVPAPCTWQFNFRFSLNTDMYAQESTQMLSKAGIDFSRHETQGVEPEAFGALLMTSGLVLDPDVHWISFHSGYDFGYLMKLMICKPLPDDEDQFHAYLEKFFPSLYDIKFILKYAASQRDKKESNFSTEAQAILGRIMTKSGLQDIAEELSVSRVGQAHQAGSDSLLTGQVYFKMREKIFNGTIEEDRYCGQVWGLNAQMPAGSGGPTTRDLNTPNMNGATFYNQQGLVQNGGGPSTPQTFSAGLSGGIGQTHTPVPPQSSHGLGGGGSGFGTPGGFGAFQYTKAMS